MRIRVALLAALSPPLRTLLIQIRASVPVLPLVSGIRPGRRIGLRGLLGFLLWIRLSILIPVMTGLSRWLPRCRLIRRCSLSPALPR
jgi:hypothetical protein